MGSLYKSVRSKVNKSDFLKSSLILTSGTTVSSLIPIITAPLLTRIFLPTDYDLLGIYMMITGIIGSFVSLQYHHVIITSHDDKEANDALVMCIVITSIISILTLILTLLLFPFISIWFKSNSLKYWLLCAPFTVFFYGWNLAFGSWANRTKNFTLLSTNRIISAIMVPMFSITLGYLVAGATGLFVGLILGQAVPSLLLSRYFFTKSSIHLHLNYSNFKQIAIKYSGFPKYSLPADFINMIVNQFPVIMFAGYFHIPGAIGSFNLSNRMLGIPVQLVASSITEVFRQKASKDFAETGNCKQTFKKTFLILFALSVIPFLLLGIFGPWLFSVIFGDKWKMAGTFSQILAPLFFLRFIVSPLSYMYFIAHKQKEDFWLHIVFTVALFSVTISVLYLSQSTTNLLIAYSSVYCLLYIWTLRRSYVFSHGLNTNIMINLHDIKK